MVEKDGLSQRDTFVYFLMAHDLATDQPNTFWDNLASVATHGSDTELLSLPSGESAATAYIQSALNSGGIFRLPGGVVVLSAPLVFSQPGTWLLSDGVNLQPTPDNRGIMDSSGITQAAGLAYLVPGSDFAQGSAPQSALITTSASDCGIRGLNLDTYGGGTVGYVVYVDGADFTMDYCSWQGPTSNVSIYLSTNVNRSNILRCYGNGQANGNGVNSLEWHGVDGKIELCRFKGGIKYIAGGNMVVTGGHWTGGNDIMLIDGAASVHVTGTLFDTPGGTPGTNGAVRHNSTGRVDLTGCSYYTEGSPNFDAVVKSGTGTLNVVGGNVWANAPAATWAHVGNGLGSGDQVVGLTAAPSTVTALWTPSPPQHYDVMWGSARHTEQMDTGTKLVTMTPTVSATANTYGAFTAVAPTSTAAANFVAIAGNWTPNGVSTETITINIKVTFSDGTTASAGPTGIAGNSTVQSLAGNIWVQLAKDGVWITGVQAQAKSSVASSTATPQVQVLLGTIG